MTSKKVSKISATKNNPTVKCPYCNTRYTLRKLDIVHREKSPLMKGDDEMIERVSFHCMHKECDQVRQAIVFK